MSVSQPLLDRRLQSWWKLLTVGVFRSLAWSAVLLPKSRERVTPGKQSLCSKRMSWAVFPFLPSSGWREPPIPCVYSWGWTWGSDQQLANLCPSKRRHELPVISNAVDLPWSAVAPMLRTHIMRCKDPMDCQQQLMSSKLRKAFCAKDLESQKMNGPVRSDLVRQIGQICSAVESVPVPAHHWVSCRFTPVNGECRLVAPEAGKYQVATIQIHYKLIACGPPPKRFDYQTTSNNH